MDDTFVFLEKLNRDLNLLKDFSIKDMEALSRELRIKISQVVTEKGGHLAPCLGVVEIIVATHHVYDFDKDRLVFDVGHQAYAHKILTGRFHDFDTIRSKGGYSGFPYPKESNYDVFRGGHASTAISTSLGIKEAYKKKGLKNHVVSIVGDGSLTGGMAFEGLNNAGALKENLTIILNDNEMSIFPTVGAMSNHFSKIRHSNLLRNLSEGLTQLTRKIPKMGSKIDEISHYLADEGSKILSPWQIFSTLGFRYYGPINGHDIKEVLEALKNTKNMKGPVIIHALTEKGRGYMPNGDEKEIIYGPHAMSPPSKNKTKKLSWSEAFSSHLIKKAKTDDKILAITAAMPDGTKLDMFEKEYPERFYDVGISEQHAVGFSSGLSYGGMSPVCCIYSTFLQRAYDQIFHEFVLQDDLSLLLGIDRAGLNGEDGASHQGVYDIGYLKVFPKMVLMSPKDAKELREMMDMAIENKWIAAIRYPKGSVPSDDLFGNKRQKLEIGKPEIILHGETSKIAIIALGVFVETAYGVAKILKEENIEIDVINARFAKPLNRDYYLNLSKQYDILITMEDASLTGGFGESIKNILCNERVIVENCGVQDELIEHMSRKEQLEYCGLDEESMVEYIKKYC